jgi:hypothetical protein
MHSMGRSREAKSLDNETTDPKNAQISIVLRLRKIPRNFHAMFLHKTMINVLVVQELVKAGDKD